MMSFWLESRCMAFQVHHALADGTSFMSLLLSLFRKANDPKAAPATPRLTRRDRRKTKVTVTTMWAAVVGLVCVLWYRLMFAMQLGARMLWVSDRDRKAMWGGDGVELWPRKIATARFCLEDMKIVKRAVGYDATINDVLSGVMSSGPSKYLDHQTPNTLQEGLEITGLAMVNLRKQPALQELSDLTKSNSQLYWGNKFGIILLSVQYQKGILQRRKQSMEAHLTYKVNDYVTSYLGPKVSGPFNYKVVCNTSFTISNMVGAQENVAIGENPVTYIRVTGTSLPHALTMHMVSFAGRADMQILAAKDIIPDPEFIAQCFEDGLLEMKEAALATTKIS